MDEARRKFAQWKYPPLPDQRSLVIRRHKVGEDDKIAYIQTLARALRDNGAPIPHLRLHLITAVLAFQSEFFVRYGYDDINFSFASSKGTKQIVLPPSPGLRLVNIEDIREVHRQVITDTISAVEGTKRLRASFTSVRYSNWDHPVDQASARWASAALSALAFGGSFVDVIATYLCTQAIHYAEQNGWILGRRWLHNLMGALGVAIILSFRHAFGAGFLCREAIWSSAMYVHFATYFINLMNVLCDMPPVARPSRYLYRQKHIALIGWLRTGFFLLCGPILMDLSIRVATDLVFENPRLLQHVNIMRTSSLGAWKENNAPQTLYFLTYLLSPSSFLGRFLTRCILFTFPQLDLGAHTTPSETIVGACSRLPDAPWYLRPLPIWTPIVAFAFILKTCHALISSFAAPSVPWRRKVTLDMKKFNVQHDAAIRIAGLAYATTSLVGAIIGHGTVSPLAGALVCGTFSAMASVVCRAPVYTYLPIGTMILVASGIKHAGASNTDHGWVPASISMFSITLTLLAGLSPPLMWAHIKAPGVNGLL